jgi:hypothetical protein
VALIGQCANSRSCHRMHTDHGLRYSTAASGSSCDSHDRSRALPSINVWDGFFADRVAANRCRPWIDPRWTGTNRAGSSKTTASGSRGRAAAMAYPSATEFLRRVGGTS